MSAETPEGAATLPYIDEHSIVVAADAAATWAALLDLVERSFSFGGTTAIARLLGAADGTVSGPRPLSRGSAFPGFHVERAVEPAELALAGRHRFSNYALTFRLESSGARQTRLQAETRAEFPSVRGSVYRGLVIGTRAHVFVTRGLLGAVRRHAQRHP